MGHQLVLVLIANPFEDAVAQVDALLEPHSDNACVEPHKEYFEPCHVYGRFWEMEDVEEFVRTARSHGEEYERDEKGFYQWAYDNPDGYYDWYVIGGRWNGIFAGLPAISTAGADLLDEQMPGNIAAVKDLPGDLYPGLLVTPDGVWSFLEWRFKTEHPSAEDFEAIRKEDLDVFRKIAERYRDYYAVAVDAHI